MSLLNGCVECGNIHIENHELILCSTCNAKRRDIDDVIYPQVKRMFLDSCIRYELECPITGTPITFDSDIHHKKGRIGFADQWARDNDISLLIDVRFFLAVSRIGHEWIEAHPKESKRLGYSVDRLNAA